MIDTEINTRHRRPGPMRLRWQAEERIWLLDCSCPAQDIPVGPDLPGALGAAQQHWAGHWADGWLDD